MKCPKCGYLGFDSGERCKNCGYDFSLVEPRSGAGPPRTPSFGGPSGAAAHDPGLARGTRYRRTDRGADAMGLDRPLAGPAEGTPIDLPLFGENGGPAVLPPPRAPLSVRRATPTPGRLRARAETPRPESLQLNLEDLAGSPDVSRTPVPAAADAPILVRDGAPERRSAVPAPPDRRAAAACLDLGLAFLIDAGALYFTLRLCDLTARDLHVLPIVPVAAFFLLLNGGYFVLFTGTLGRTLGKMAAGIEVVSDRQGGMDLRCAVLRTFAAALSIAPAGLGWLVGLVGERRALHDRLTGTRVILTSTS